MRIFVKELNDYRELSITDSNGLDWTEDFMEIDHLQNTGQFSYDDDLDAWVCNKDEYEWWKDYINDYCGVEERLEEVREIYGCEAVEEAIKDAYCGDAEDIPGAVNMALDDAFGEAES